MEDERLAADFGDFAERWKRAFPDGENTKLFDRVCAALDRHDGLAGVADTAVEHACEARQDAMADRYGGGSQRVLRWAEIPECDYKTGERDDMRAALRVALSLLRVRRPVVTDQMVRTLGGELYLLGCHDDALTDANCRKALQAALSAAPPAAAPGPSAEDLDAQIDAEIRASNPPQPLAGVRLKIPEATPEQEAYMEEMQRRVNEFDPNYVVGKAPPPDLRAKLVEAACSAAQFTPNGWSANAWKALAAWVQS